MGPSRGTAYKGVSLRYNERNRGRLGPVSVLKSMSFLSFAAARLLALFVISTALVVAQPANRLMWSSYVSGGRFDSVAAVIPNADGTVWVGGTSSSGNDSPLPDTAYQVTPKGGREVFLAKYQPQADGTTKLLYWTWIGGSDDDELKAMTIDNRGRIYLTGTTKSSDFPLAATPAQTTNNGGSSDIFVSVIDSNVVGEFAMLYSTYYGGAGLEVPNAIAVAPDRQVVVAGYTASEDFPKASSGLQGNSRGGWDAFLLRLNPDNSDVYATYLGGNKTDVATGVAVLPTGVILMSGYTASDDFPATSDGSQTFLNGAYDSFLVEIDLRRSGLDALRYGTYLGASGSDLANTMRLAADGSIWLAGHTTSVNLPTSSSSVQRSFGGNVDGFAMRLKGTAPYTVEYATYFGGPGFEVAQNFTLLPGGRFAMVGYTMFGGLPVAGGPLRNTPASSFADAFVAVGNATGTLEFASYLGGTFLDVASAVAVGPDGNLVVAGYTTSVDLPVTDGSRQTNSAPLPAGFVAKLRTAPQP